MRRIIVAISLALVLTGCAAITKNRLYFMENTYGVALAQAVAYRNLGICPTGTVATLAKPCASRSIVLKLQAADKAAQSALSVARTLQTDVAVSAADSAVSNFSAMASNPGASP